MPNTPNPIRYLTAAEVQRLTRYAEARALQAERQGKVTAIRAWALLDTLLCSGLRASEIAALRVGDCRLGYAQSALAVRRGKGNRNREVIIPQALKAHLKAFLAWKRGRGEDVAAEAIVFTGQRGPLTRNGVWRLVKALMRAVGLDPRYATHTCRHTFATHLYRASGADLEVVQEQLGHANIKTTMIYAKVTKEDKLRAADALAKVYRNSQRTGQRGASLGRRRALTAENSSQIVASSRADSRLRAGGNPGQRQADDHRGSPARGQARERRTQERRKHGPHHPIGV